MPDERQDSIRQGIHAPEESEEGQRAAEEKRRTAPDAPPIGGGMGGTSDADSPADEALYQAQRNAAESEDSEEIEASEELRDAADAADADEGQSRASP